MVGHSFVGMPPVVLVLVGVGGGVEDKFEKLSNAAVETSLRSASLTSAFSGGGRGGHQ